jgi:hypothetical protein
MTRTNAQPTDNSNPEAEKNAEPAEKVTLFPVEAAIWKNVSRGGDPFYSVTFERKYRDQDTKWKSTASFGGDDLLLLAKVADLAHSRVVELRSKDRQMKPPAP